MKRMIRGGRRRCGRGRCANPTSYGTLLKHPAPRAIVAQLNGFAALTCPLVQRLFKVIVIVVECLRHDHARVICACPNPMKRMILGELCVSVGIGQLFDVRHPLLHFGVVREVRGPSMMSELVGHNVDPARLMLLSLMCNLEEGVAEVALSVHAAPHARDEHRDAGGTNHRALRSLT